MSACVAFMQKLALWCLEKLFMSWHWVREALTLASRASHREGWEGALDNLAVLVRP